MTKTSSESTRTCSYQKPSLRKVLLLQYYVRAACRLHDTVLINVMKAPMRFFDANPPGRILNRFSKDLDEGNIYHVYNPCNTSKVLYRRLVPFYVNITIILICRNLLIFLFITADVYLPQLQDTLFQIGNQVLISLITAIVVLPWIAIAIVPVSIFFYFFKIVSSVSVRQFKRLENIARSPLLGHVNTSAQGLTTIVAFKQQANSIQRYAVR